MSKFKCLITVSPLGLMYGSAGGFLSPENLVGRAGAKFPPDTGAIAGLFFNANREQKFAEHQELRNKLVVAGPFWAKQDTPKEFYVPIPWHQVIAEKEDDEWFFVKKEPNVTETIESNDNKWCLGQHKWERQNKDLKPEYSWQSIDSWNLPASDLRERQAFAKAPWEFLSFLHPKIKTQERHVVEKDGLFLENAVQLHEDCCLVYLSNYKLPDGWYRFGGEGHLVEIESHPLSEKHKINRLLNQNQKIQHAFALIAPGVWGSNKLSYRYPIHPEFPRQGLKMLTDKAVPYRYRLGHSKKEELAGESEIYDPKRSGRLSRGRYAVPAGSVYVFKHPLNLTWWDFPDEWFPKEGFPLKHLGCGLCLPIDIQGVPKCTTKPTE
ncbi:MAG: CRISPR-associated protein [Microcoleus sp. SU_5_6]|nr:CRISPR-associated protein [Microcoleus sp. SU_5_6]